MNKLYQLILHSCSTDSSCLVQRNPACLVRFNWPVTVPVLFNRVTYVFEPQLTSDQRKGSLTLMAACGVGRRGLTILLYGVFLLRQFAHVRPEP